MTVLPEPTPTAPAAGQATPTDADRDQVRRLMAALDEITLEKPTAVRIEDPSVPSYADGARIGTAPPVAQPGVPPMSRQATDISRAAMYCGLATVPPGLIAIGILIASEHADATVIGMICAAPAALALAIARLLRRAGQAAPPEVHQYYSGPVHQQTTHSSTRGVWAKTDNRQ